jgi:hypothetical protein
MNSSRLGVWNWAQCVQKSELPFISKAICYNLYLYMSSTGEGCWPSIARQMLDLGITKPTILRYLRIAREAGFLTIRKQRGEDGRQGVNVYVPTFPKGTQFADAPAGTIQGKPDLPNLSVQGKPDDIQGKPHDTPEVNHVYRNYPYNYPDRTIHEGQGKFDDESDLESNLSDMNHSIKKEAPPAPSLRGVAIGAGIRGTSLVPGIQH